MKRFSRLAAIAMLSILFLPASLAGGNGAAATTESAVTSGHNIAASKPFPAKIAFTRNHQLWLYDASGRQATPRQVTSSGSVEIVGWSHDGEYLMYTRRESPESFGDPYLWVVKADGSGAQQVGTRPIVGTPEWSPRECSIAFLTGTAPDRMILSVAQIDRQQTIQIRQLPANPLTAEFAWATDGNSLYLSIPAAKARPIQLERIEAKTGRVLQTYRLGSPPKVEEGIYPYLADGLTLSPDGRYVAYFEKVTSGSLTADGVAIKLFDLATAAVPRRIGEGLAYPEWLAWSPDSRQLAIVDGGGREATANKHVVVIEAAIGKPVFDSKEKGMVDTQPVWTKEKHATLYFLRGKENLNWLGNYDPMQLLVPGQRILAYDGKGKPQPVTAGPKNTADFYPQPSPANNYILYLRLSGPQHGALYAQKIGETTARQLFSEITGEIGYYGNYLPKWFQVFWLEGK